MVYHQIDSVAIGSHIWPPGGTGHNDKKRKKNYQQYKLSLLSIFYLFHCFFSFTTEQKWIPKYHVSRGKGSRFRDKNIMYRIKGIVTWTGDDEQRNTYYINWFLIIKRVCFLINQEIGDHIFYNCRLIQWDCFYEVFHSH